MQSIAVCKAEPISSDEPVESAVLRIDGKLPMTFEWSDEERLKKAAAFYEAQAVLIMQALDSLPGGTIHHLTALLLEKKASYLRVRS